MKFATGCGSINRDCVESPKNLNIFVEKIYKKRCLESIGMPVLYIGCKVPKG
jgi:hypothetical protein